MTFEINPALIQPNFHSIYDFLIAYHKLVSNHILMTESGYQACKVRRQFTIASVRRILFVVNVLIAIVLIAAGVVFYWYLYRALPRTSGTIEALVTQPV